MFERECRIYAFVIEYAKKLAADIEDASMTLQPAPGMNSPQWVLGHLCVTMDYAGRLLGLPFACPREWGKSFGPGSDPATPPASGPTKAELIAMLETIRDRVTEAARKATPEQVAGPHGFAPLADVLPTAGDMVANLMTAHAMMHLGQLSAWRRLQGLPAVLGF